MNAFMKLQKRLSRKYKGKEYYKWIISLPDEDVRYADLKEGDELAVHSEAGVIKLVKRSVK